MKGGFMVDSKKFWAKQAKRYSGSSDVESINTINRISSYLNHEDVVLDFACGTGGSTRAISSKVKHVVGVDFSSDMIKYAKENVDNGEGMTFLVSDIHDEKLENYEYNIITAFNVLHLLDDLEGCVNRIKDLLIPGGLFISLTPCLGPNKGLTAKVVNLISRLGLIPKIEGYTPKILEGRMKSQGFDCMLSESTEEVIPNLLLILKKSDN